MSKKNRRYLKHFPRIVVCPVNEFGVLIWNWWSKRLPYNIHLICNYGFEAVKFFAFELFIYISQEYV